MRITLAPMRVVPPHSSALPLPVLIACLEERLTVAQADDRVPLGCLAELLSQTLPYLRQLEARRA